MKSIALDSILLFVLVVPFIMAYRLSPGPTPYWLFGLIFLGLLIYLILDIYKLSEKLYFKLKNITLWVIIAMVLGSAFFSVIVVRHQVAPVYTVHDIILQQEAAIRFFIHGTNPYEVTYFGTPLEQWHYSDTEINPALYHYVMQPFYLIFALPFYSLSNNIIGYFDARIPLYFLFFSLLIFASFLVKDQNKKRLFITLLAFNPAMLSYTLEGRSDVFMFSFLFMGLYLLHIKKYFLAGIPIALAFAVKQSVWPILPFYLLFLYLKTGKFTLTLKSLVPFIITFAVFILPFFFWNPKAFLDSTIFYLSGNTPNSYPISGYGLGMILHDAGVINDLRQYYPFHIWQLVIGLPLLLILLKVLKKKSTVGRLILVYGIFLFVYWYLSRYLNNSHVGYLSMVFITAYFWPEDRKDVEKV